MSAVRHESDLAPSPGPVGQGGLWRLHAACRGIGPGRWFEEQGGQAREAISVCASCPVRQDCLQESLMGEWTIYGLGVWGGASERVRRGLERELLACPHPRRAFVVDGCGCGFCRVLGAHERRMARVAGGGSDLGGGPLVTFGPGASHGNATTYARGCRCEPCRQGMRAQRRARRAAVRAEAERGRVDGVIVPEGAEDLTEEQLVEVLQGDLGYDAEGAAFVVDVVRGRAEMPSD